MSRLGVHRDDDWPDGASFPDGPRGPDGAIPPEELNHHMDRIMGVHRDDDAPDGESGVLTYLNGHVLGEFYREVDGYYVFVFADPNKGAWEAHVLREIADTLDEMNATWDKEVRDTLR